MLIKIEDTKYNFIDKNDLYVGYDTSTDCCETADWFIADKPTPVIDYPSGNSFDITDYIFDPTTTLIGRGIDMHSIREASSLDEGDVVIFRLICAGKPALWLHLYNAHNGYYGHSLLTNVSGYDTDIVL